jgi:DNA-binding HxlR family transcriptional regulator
MRESLLEKQVVKEQESLDSITVNEKPFLYTMSLINGKWKLHILFWLSKRKVLRYGELRKLLGNITHKMLSAQLKELERDNLIIRTEYQQIPPKVEYTLSDTGISLMPVLNSMCGWGAEHLPDNE